MANISSIRDKLTTAMAGIIVLYLAALAIFAFKLWPTNAEISRIQIEISDQKRHEENLLAIIEQRPVLEQQKQNIQERLLSLERRIPTQYDLPELLETLERLGTSCEVQLDSLEHMPFRAEPGNFFGTIPLLLEVAGKDSIFSYLLQIQDLFPSLQISEAVLQYAGSNRFEMSVRASLQVLLAKDAVASNWQRPVLLQSSAASTKINTFGLPFTTVQRFLTGQVQVLGIIETEGKFNALITKEGEKLWVESGDSLGDAVIKAISADGVFLDVDGVDIRLTIGG